MPSSESYRPALVAGRYRVTGVQRLASPCDVVDALEVKTGRRVVLHRHREPTREQLVRLRELARALEDPPGAGVARILELRQTRTDAWLVFEEVPGLPLTDWWASLPISDSPSFAERWRFAAPVVSALLEAVGVLAYAGVAHMDLAPWRVRVDPAGVARIDSVGLVGSFPAAEPKGELDAQYGCLAPELVDSQVVGPAADQFGLAAIVYWMITGRRAVAGGTLAELHKAYRRGRAQPPTEWRPDTPKALEDALMRMLQWSPNERFADLSGARSAMAPHLQPSPGPVLQPWATVPPSLVGREPFERFLRRRLIELKQGSGSVVRIVAGAGAGKSRLLEAWAEQANAEGDVAVYSASCEPGSAVAVLAGWFAADVNIELPPPADLVEQALGRLKGPTVLLLDGLEGLDPIAWARVHRTAEAAANGSARLLVVLAGRVLPTLEPRIPAASPRLFNVGLAPLQARDVRALLLPESEDPEDVEIAEAAAEGWCGESGGVPGALVERLLAEERAGGVVREGRRWRMQFGKGSSSPEAPLPPLLTQFLAWLRLLGDQVEVDLVLTALPFDRTAVLDCLRYGRDHGMLEFRWLAGHWRIVGGGDAASSTTELYGTEQVHGRAARWLEANHTADGFLAERAALHWRQAGRSDLAAQGYQRASDAAGLVGSTGEARRLAQLATAFVRRGRR